MKEKIVFFDVDGTLWDRNNGIPESTAEAIDSLKANGHRVFLNSGRALGYIINEKLLSLGFDGIVAGCGTQIRYRGELIFCHRIPADLAAFTLDVCRRYQFRPILEGVDHLYYDDADFGTDSYGMKIKREIGDKLLPITGNEGKWDISKLAVAMDGPDTEEGLRVLSPYYDFLIHIPTIAEFVPKGFSKGSGIREVCELLGTDIEDTFAFGDGINDLPMFEAAGTSICMGDGREKAKEAADYVTAPMKEDGIFKACRHFGLI